MKWLREFIGAVARIVMPKAASGTADTLEKLAPLAVPIVESLDGSGTDNETKRKAAVMALEAAAKRAGIVAATWLLNLTVQTVIGMLRAKAEALTAAKAA